MTRHDKGKEMICKENWQTFQSSRKPMGTKAILKLYPLTSHVSLTQIRRERDIKSSNFIHSCYLIAWIKWAKREVNVLSAVLVMPHAIHAAEVECSQTKYVKETLQSTITHDTNHTFPKYPSCIFKNE
jgi:hypothetical protein